MCVAEKRDNTFVSMLVAYLGKQKNVGKWLALHHQKEALKRCLFSVRSGQYLELGIIFVCTQNCMPHTVALERQGERSAVAVEDAVLRVGMK